MINKLKQRKQEGFTIIEVMIVLAIAGLIMIVVFLAVPALQRSGRNNALESSVNNVLGAVSTYTSNNGGALPPAASAWSFAAPNLTIGATGSNQERVTVDAGVPAITYARDAAASLAITTSATTGTIQVLTGVNAICNDAKTGLGTAGAGSSRSIAALYIAESGSGKIRKCVES